MSATLRWEPVREQDGNYISYELKNILGHRYDFASGPFYLTEKDNDFLIGIKIALESINMKGSVVKEINGLLQVIEKYEKIKIWLEY